MISHSEMSKPQERPYKKGTAGWFQTI